MNASPDVRWVVAISLGLACASVETPPLEHWSEHGGYRVDLDVPDVESNRTMVILSFSGGGTRAAAFAYGVLQRLEKDRLGGTGPPLLSEVDVISSVSGGSFTAAYYALNREATFPGFRDRFLYVDVQSKLGWLLANPVNLVRLMSPHFSRSDLAAEYYDEHIFDGQEFGALLEKERRPYVVVNATDIATGDRFEFLQSQLDWMCADLSEIPIARAVAASSAFPGLLSPITLQNRGGSCGMKEPEWIEWALDPEATVNPPRRVVEALRLESLAESGHDPWVHLIDGGVADNIGLRGTIWALEVLDSPWSLIRRMNLRQTDRVVVIAVNAKNDRPSRLGRRRSAPGFGSVLKAAATVPMGHYSFDTIELIENYFDQADKDMMILEEYCKCSDEDCDPDALMHRVDFFPIHVHFGLEKDEKTRRDLEHIDTNFGLPREQVDLLIREGAKLLEGHPEYRRLVGR